mgnify:FL=1
MEEQDKPLNPTTAKLTGAVINRLLSRIEVLEEENHRVSKYAADAEKRVAELELICKEYEDELFELKKGY